MDVPQSPIEQQYRMTADREEISQILRYFCRLNITLTAWQRRPSGERLIVPVSIERYNPTTEELKLMTAQRGHSFGVFNPQKELYLHAHYKKFVAQTAIDYIGHDHLMAKRPQQIHTEEMRINPRKKFYSDNYRVRFTKQKVWHEYPLIDISQSGMAFKVPIGPATVFNYKDDEIQVSEFFDNELDEELKGNIVYIRDLDEDAKFRVGVRFQTPISLPAP